MRAQANDETQALVASKAAGQAGRAVDAIAGALQKFGLRHPTRPVGVAKIDLATSFTQASSSPAAAAATESAATSEPQAAVAGWQLYLDACMSVLYTSMQRLCQLVD